MPNGTVIKAVYNDFGHKVQEIEDDGGLNLTTSYTYDRNGNLETRTDPEGMVTRYTYDALNRLTGETQDEGGLNLITTYRYDQAGNLRFLTDAKNQTTEMVYDAMNRLKQEIRPMSEETAYWYDEAGNLEQKQDAKGQTTTYTYNDTDQLTQISYADGKTVTFTYDRVGNLETYSDGTTSATYTYDDLGRKLSETVNYGAFTKAFSYTYFPNGLKKTFTMPDGPTYSYTYDDDDQLTHLTIPGLGDIAYPSYTMGRPDSVTFPGGSQQTYQYDALMRVEHIQAPEMDYQYTSYDGVSNILTKSTEHGNYIYKYDDVYRLTDVDNPIQDDEAYTYDGVGNRETASGVSGAITHNANNELTIYGDISYDYDANGNLIRKSIGIAAVNYFYNVKNRLIRVEDEATQTVLAEYDYDPFGRRLWKDVGGVRTYFLYADEGLIAEYDENGVEMRSYGYKPDSTWTIDPLFQKVGFTYYWYQNDHLGTPQKLIDMNGTVVWSAQYTAFGEAVVDVGAVTNNLRFPGQYEDVETGLHYNWFRYYDSKIGRYIRTDPIGFAGEDVNLYAYVRSNPANFGDAWGWVQIRKCHNISPDKAAPDASNCLGGALTGRTDVCLAPDSTRRPEDSFLDALIKSRLGMCTPVTSKRNCSCPADQTMILITLVIPEQEQAACDPTPEAGPPEAVVEQCQRNREIIATGNPWTDPTFWWGFPLSDLHAIRVLPGKDVLEHISSINEEGPSPFGPISPEDLQKYFPDNHPMLCCCK